MRVLNQTTSLEPLTAVKPHPENPRRGATAAIVDSIQAHGFYGALIAQRSTRYVIAGRHTIVDGFHRYHVLNTTPTLREATAGMAPIVTLNTDAPGRIAATVRHNRARGTHTLTGMSNLIFQMLDAGMADHEISTELGMSRDELTRLKHVTGFSRLFEDVEYNRAWLTKNQIRARLAYQAEHPDDPNDLP